MLYDGTDNAILWPAVALVMLVFAVWLTLFAHRMAHMRARPPQAQDLVSREAYKNYAGSEPAADNLANLFEMPVLFLALVAFLYTTQLWETPQLLLAWAFVAARAAHSVVHIVVRKVPLRFLAYLLSCVVLLAMWIGFAVRLAAG